MPVTGNTIYKNYCAQQHENFYSTFRVFLERIRPERILEIGTGHGGLIVALHDILKEIKQPCSIRLMILTNTHGTKILETWG